MTAGGEGAQGAGGGRAVVVVADRELRTPKYLFALSLGRPVVTFAHLDACVASKVYGLCTFWPHDLHCAHVYAASCAWG